MTVFFVTPGVLPLDAFTKFGVNHKPNTSNPIGYFGTGLKYAIAIIVRHGGTVELRTPKGEFVFYGRDLDFRGKGFKGLQLKRRRLDLMSWRYEQMPFTTELGKNWHLWQAYRELLTNTLDEKGYVAVDLPVNAVSDDYSIIKVTCNGFDRWLNPEHKSEVYFEPDGQPLYEVGGVQMWDRPSQYFYYKGVRVFDLPQPARFTYNFTDHVELSEDRTIRNQWLVMIKLVEAIDKLPSQVVAKLLRKIEGEPDSYESRMSFDIGTLGNKGGLAAGLQYGKSRGYHYGYYGQSALEYLDRGAGTRRHAVNLEYTSEQWNKLLTAIQHMDSEGPIGQFYTDVVDDVKTYASLEVMDVILRGLDE